MAAWTQFVWALLGALVLLLRATNGVDYMGTGTGDQSALFPSETSLSPLQPSAGKTLPSRTKTDHDPSYYEYLSGPKEAVASSASGEREASERSSRNVRAIRTHLPSEGVLENRVSSEDKADSNRVVFDENYARIQPTRTVSTEENRHLEMTEKWVWGEEDGHQSGEGGRASRGRKLLPSGPRPRASALPTQTNATASELHARLNATASGHRSTERKTNPDIQDIITGIVKLLNGNVKVQANPNIATPHLGGGRPPRPLLTRINNRGPPRIGDVPPNFDLQPEIPPSQPDNIGMMPPPPPRIPPPYPFEPPQQQDDDYLDNAHQNGPPPMFFETSQKPHKDVIPLPPQPNQSANLFVNGVPLPEQVVPVNHIHPTVSTEKRPIGPLNRPAPEKPRPFIGPQNRPMIGPLNRPPGYEGRPGPPHSRPVLRPRPRPRPPPANKRRPQPPSPANANKKPHIPVEGEVVFGNKKKDPQYITVDESNQDVATEEGHSGVSLTVGGDDVDEVTFTTIQPPAEDNTDLKVDPSNFSQAQTNQTSSNSTASKQQVVPTNTSSGVVENVELEFRPLEEKEKTTTSTTEATPTPTPTPNTTSSEAKEPENATTTEGTPVRNDTGDVPKIIASMTSSASTVNEATSGEEGLKPPVVETSPVFGLGEATPVIEPSIPFLDDISSTSTIPTSSLTKPHYSTTGVLYRPRPGIVLDDTEYKPLGAARPIITAPPRVPGHLGEVFDVTVSAIQGPTGNTGKPYIYPVEIEGVKLPAAGGGEVSVITSAEEGQHFVSIDGKRTYINLFNTDTEAPSLPTRVQPSQPTTHGAGYAVPDSPPKAPSRPPSRPVVRPPLRRPQHQPPVRIDTCIVGDDTTCDQQQNERCLTENGVSSCHCRPSYSRRKHREPCRRVISIAMSLRVDKLYDKRVTWTQNLQSRDSEEYQQLTYEASRALDSAMSMTPFSDEFMGTRVNNIYPGVAPGDSKPVYVNVTLQLEENGDTSRPTVKQDIQRHLLGVIHRRNNNIGDSALWVDSPPGSVSHLQDVDECSSKELHDCHKEATCSNVFGSFRCSCTEGTRDPWVGNTHKQGRHCETCSAEHCNNRGTCRFDSAGQQACSCSSGYYGSQCEIDGEVLGVAIGASVAAVIIIGLTLVCLCMWSRRWSREQKTAAGLGSPVFGYMAAGGSTVKTPAMGAPPYQVSLEDRLRWAQIADVMAQANHYAPEPVSGPGRPSSVYGYPSLGTLQRSTMGGHMGSMNTLPHMGMLGPQPPIPMPRSTLPHNTHMLNVSQGQLSLHGGTFNPHQGMRTPDTKKTFESSSSDEEDRTDLLGRNFHVPRPKSRSSVANQSGIYYDVDYEQDTYTNKQQNPSIPMSTYGMSRAPYFRQ